MDSTDSTQEEIRFYTENASTHNCYAFALSAKSGIYGHPGAATGKPLRSLRQEEISAALLSDGLEAPKRNGIIAPLDRDGYYLVAAVAAGYDTDGRKGYHFYRKMAEGTWWHKLGKLPPTNRDAEGREIHSPASAARDYSKGSISGNPSRRTGYDRRQPNYNLFAGYYYVPEQGLTVGKGMLPQEYLEYPEYSDSESVRSTPSSESSSLWSERIAGQKNLFSHHISLIEKTLTRWQR